MSRLGNCLSSLGRDFIPALAGTGAGLGVGNILIYKQHKAQFNELEANLICFKLKTSAANNDKRFFDEAAQDLNDRTISTNEWKRFMKTNPGLAYEAVDAVINPKESEKN